MNPDDREKILEVKKLKTYFKVGVGKRKLKVKAVDDISFDVYKKEVFGLVGESGCGKTTTGRTIIRLYRPTDGMVTLNGKIIGAGHNEFYKEMKYARISYRKEIIKLNSKKYAVFKIREKYGKVFRELDNQIEALKEKFRNDKAQVELEILEYDKIVFENSQKHKLDLENIKYEYLGNMQKLRNKAINIPLSEYKDKRKVLKRVFISKYSGISQSVGLDKKDRNVLKLELKKQHLIDLEELEKAYKDKIVNYGQNIIPKEKFKKESIILKEKYSSDVSLCNEKNSVHVKTMVAPNIEKISADVAALKKVFDDELLVIKEKINKQKENEKEEIKAVPKENIVDRDALAKLKFEHKEYMKSRWSEIRKTKALHFSEEAKKTSLNIQMIFQDPIASLNPRMTVLEIVSEGLIIAGIKDKNEIKDKVVEALKLVGLSPDYLTRYPHEFSGGQRQRIGIARALIMNPSFIIADEPISALDVSIRAQVINLLQELKEKLGLTILFIAHDLSVVRFFCDRIAVMFGGRIVEQASSEELFKNPLHPYTKSLLSAVPQPDPDYEKFRKRIIYNPFQHDYRHDEPELTEIKKEHFVLCNKQELEEMKKELV